MNKTIQLCESDKASLDEAVSVLLNIVYDMDYEDHALGLNGEQLDNFVTHLEEAASSGKIVIRKKM